jgi:hypothetical protein
MIFTLPQFFSPFAVERAKADSLPFSRSVYGQDERRHQLQRLFAGYLPDPSPCGL